MTVSGPHIQACPPWLKPLATPLAKTFHVIHNSAKLNKQAVIHKSIIFGKLQNIMNDSTSHCLQFCSMFGRSATPYKIAECVNPGLPINLKYLSYSFHIENLLNFDHRSTNNILLFQQSSSHSKCFPFCVAIRFLILNM